MVLNIKPYDICSFVSSLFHLAFFEIHPYCSIYQISFSRPNNVPFHVYRFIHSSLEGHLSSFQLLAILSNVAINIGHPFESLLSVLLSINVDVALLGHLVILCLIFWRTAILFPTLAYHFIFCSPVYRLCHFYVPSHFLFICLQTVSFLFHL